MDVYVIGVVWVVIKISVYQVLVPLPITSLGEVCPVLWVDLLVKIPTNKQVNMVVGMASL